MRRGTAILLGLATALLVVLLGVRWWRLEPVATVGDIRATVDDEELGLRLRVQLQRLISSSLNLTLPDHHSRSVFAEEVEVIDVAAPVEPASPGSLAITSQTWPMSGSQRVDRDALRLLAPLFASVRYFDRVQIGLLKISRNRESPEIVETDLKLSAIGRDPGGVVDVRAKLQVVWHQHTARDQPWRIRAWRTRSLTTRQRARRMFREISTRVLDADTRAEARRSPHQEHVIQYVSTRELIGLDARQQKYFRAPSTMDHPGLAVADIDADGHDDIYIARRWAPNLLLRNRGDGTYEEVAARVGLDVRGSSSSAVFADFDNDGDLDVFVGRMLERSLFLVNEGGRYVDRSATHVETPLPFLTTSLSVADYNNDGLLDVYFSTYGFPTVAGAGERFLADFDLERKLGSTLTRRWRRAWETHRIERWLDHAGPPNLLLVNTGGGRFAIAPENEQVRGSSNSFQATWADYDADGDLDLHVCNDFAQDHLYRNDGPGAFVDVTRETLGEAATTFAMGATWGDYDNDGRLDLYVSSMYSKAGTRITARFPRLDPRLARLASGNVLLRNLGGRFEHVAQAARAGWSWGCLFVDLDNDGLRDLVVANGHYSAPPTIATTVDL